MHIHFLAYYFVVMSLLWLGMGSSNAVHALGTEKTLAWLIGGLWWMLAAIFVVLL